MDDCVLLLSMPSIVSRLETSLPSVHNEPITCTINGWHTATYSMPARADLRARAVPDIIQFTCYYYRQLTSYSQVEGIHRWANNIRKRRTQSEACTSTRTQGWLSLMMLISATGRQSVQSKSIRSSPVQ